MREPAHDALMERVDEHGEVIGFSILGVDQLRANGLGNAWANPRLREFSSAAASLGRLAMPFA
jgi:hypothetical protein